MPPRKKNVKASEIQPAIVNSDTETETETDNDRFVKNQSDSDSDTDDGVQGEGGAPEALRGGGPGTTGGGGPRKIWRRRGGGPRSRKYHAVH